MEGKRGGRRNIERPVFWWLDDVELYLRNIGVEICRVGYLDRAAWASVVKERNRLKGRSAEEEEEGEGEEGGGEE